MKTKCLFSAIIILTIMSSCGVPKSDYDNLLSDKLKLERELDECKNGADKLIAMIDKAYQQKDFQTAKQNIVLLSTKHPESPKNAEYKELLKKIGQIELEIAQKKETEEKERFRLANVNNTGIWSIAHYVDEFGEPTKKAYVTNTDYIKGFFSNTATQNSDLNVNFLITNSYNISIKLYEYASNNPVKAYSSESYYVFIQDKDGNRISLTATNSSDRLSFDQSASNQVHKILLKGGLIKFRIEEVETSTTQYQFNIQNADYYDNAYKLLTESKSK